jgi:Fe-S-cluster containining protein
MDLVTDPARIWALSKEQKDENESFRAFLARGERTQREIDGVAHAVNREVSGQIECTRCGHCCRVLMPLLSEKDIRRLSRHLQLSETVFRSRYMREEPIPVDGGWPFATVPCPLQQGNLCTVYPARPRVCRSYPNLHKPGVVSRLDRIVSNLGVCPIVFNVYEGMKRELRP